MESINTGTTDTGFSTDLFCCERNTFYCFENSSQKCCFFLPNIYSFVIKLEIFT